MCNIVWKQRETGSEGALVRALREGDDAAKTAAARTLCNRADLYFECQLRPRRGPMVDVRPGDFLDSLLSYSSGPCFLPIHAPLREDPPFSLSLSLALSLPRSRSLVAVQASQHLGRKRVRNSQLQRLLSRSISARFG